jgi:hypothetical protein
MTYTDEEAEEILKLASRKTSGGAVTQEKLLASAAELGISVEAVQEAEREIAVTRVDMENRALFDRHRKSVFLNSLAGTLAFAAFLCGIDIYTSGGLNWAGWALLWWAYQLVTSGWEAYGQRGEAYNTAYQKWRLKRETGTTDEEEEESHSCLRTNLRMRINDGQALRVGISRRRN